jgi:hypothetical protein
MNAHPAGLKLTGYSLCAVLLFSSAVSADSIVLTGGALVADLESAAHLDARAGDNFRIIGAGDFNGGRFEPWSQCIHADQCGPGQIIDLGASWSGSDFTGRVEIDGTSHPLGLATEENYSAIVRFMGTVIAPGFDGSLFNEVSAPFTFSGTLWPPASPDPGPASLLSGSGTATLRLSWVSNQFEEGWRFDRAVYAFSPATPVPEPGSIVLLGIGLSGLIGRRLRKRS